MTSRNLETLRGNKHAKKPRRANIKGHAFSLLVVLCDAGLADRAIVSLRSVWYRVFRRMKDNTQAGQTMNHVTTVSQLRIPKPSQRKAARQGHC